MIGTKTSESVKVGVKLAKPGDSSAQARDGCKYSGELYKHW